MLAVQLLLWEPHQVGRVLLAVLVHELGHGTVMALTGAGVREIRLHAFGVQLRTQPCLLSVPEELLLYGSGPAVNLQCALVLWHISPETAQLHLGLGLFNLLPCTVLDGGAALHCLWAAHPQRLRGCSWCCTVLLAAAAVWMGAARVPVPCVMAVYLGVSELSELFFR